MTTRSLMRRLRALLSRTTVERELGDEVAFHLQMEIDDLVRTRGLSPEEAERQARLRFGGVDRHVEAHRDARGVRWIEEGLADLRYAARSLRRTPAFTVSVTLVLALGIGASTAIFSAVNTVIISHLPYPADDRLIRIYNTNSPTNRWSLSLVDYRAISEQQRTLTAVGAMQFGQSPVSVAGAEPTLMEVHPTTGSMFTTLGVSAAVGRTILTADEAQSALPVAVVSDAFARRSFGSAAGAVGKTIDIDGSPREVVGVLPPDRRELAGFRADIWPSYQPRTPTRRGPFGILVIGRMKDGVALASAERDLTSISKRIFPIWSVGFADTVAHFTAVPLRTAIIGDAPKTLWMFAGAAALLLLTAVLNVTNLMLARMTTRAREISLRSVLGASRGRLARLVIAETTLVSGIGSIAGIIAAWGILKLLVAIATTMPRIAGATIDGRALAFAIGVGVLVGLAIGIHPVLTLVGGSRTAHAGNREIGTNRQSSRLRGGLVAAEFALALPLLAGAGQLMQSIAKLQRVNPGFDAERIAYTRVVLPRARYDSAYKIGAYWTHALADVARIPGVAAVGYTTELPPDNVGNMNNFTLEGGSAAPGAPEPMAPWLVVSPGYFDAIGARLIAGRMFVPSDTGGIEALIVSESFAKHYSSDRPVLGRRVFEGGCTAETCPPLYIVGIVSDVKYNGMAENGDAAYGPSTQGMGRAGFMMIRTSGPPAPTVAGVRSILTRIDGSAPVDTMSTMSERMFASTAAPRHWTLLLAGFAIAALTLAAVGIFGLLSYLVSTMRREIGVRVALGAQRGEIARMVVARGFVSSATGALIGVVIAVAGRQLLAASLYDVTPGDPPTLLLVTAGLLLVALAASWLPARQASRIDPMTAIRAD